MWLIWKNYIIPSLEAFLLLELMIEGKDVVKWSLIVFCVVGKCPNGHMAPSSAVLRVESLGDRKQRGGWILL